MVLSRAVMLGTLRGDEVFPKNPCLTSQKPKLGSRAWRLLLLTECLPHCTNFLGLQETSGILIKGWTVLYCTLLFFFFPPT